MTVREVEEAIKNANSRISEWQENGFPTWREDQTRYGIIDPIIRALGWNTADPKQCHPEFPRTENGGRVDYALFVDLDIGKLREEDIPPDIIIEAKALGEPLGQHFDQLREYVQSHPHMSGGLAVLTNGVEWRLHAVGVRGGLPRNLKDDNIVNIQDVGPRRAALILNRQLGRSA